jgi:hypothetical protein
MTTVEISDWINQLDFVEVVHNMNAFGLSEYLNGSTP